MLIGTRSLSHIITAFDNNKGLKCDRRNVGSTVPKLAKARILLGSRADLLLTSTHTTNPTTLRMATSQTLKSALSNIPSLTKAFVTTLVALSCTSYIYIYRLQLTADDPAETNAFLGCPFIGILPGLYDHFFLNHPHSLCALTRPFIIHRALYNPWTFLTAAFYEDNVFAVGWINEHIYTIRSFMYHSHHVVDSQCIDSFTLWQVLGTSMG